MFTAEFKALMTAFCASLPAGTKDREAYSRFVQSDNELQSNFRDCYQADQAARNKADEAAKAAPVKTDDLPTTDEVTFRAKK